MSRSIHLVGPETWKLRFYADFYKVYTLWKHPRLLPLLQTPDAVLSKMRGGADLMTPGLAGGPPFPAGATKGSSVAIASLENPTVPLVVGVCEIGINSLAEVRGLKGRAVRSLHWEGDEIWAWNQVGKPGRSAPEHIEGWVSGSESEMAESEMEVSEMTLHGSSNMNVDDSETDVKHVEHPVVDGEHCTPFEGVSISQMEMSTRGVRPVSC